MFKKSKRTYVHGWIQEIWQSNNYQSAEYNKHSRPLKPSQFGFKEYHGIDASEYYNRSCRKNRKTIKH